MKKFNLILTSCLSLAAVALASGIAIFSSRKGAEEVKAATTGHVDTNIATYYNDSTASPDGSYLKTLDVNQVCALGDGTIVNMTGEQGGSDKMPQIRNRNNADNYYVYLRGNSAHSAVGQLGNGLIFTAEGSYLMDKVSLFNSYQIQDAFQIERYDLKTATYVVEVSDQMFSGSNKTYEYTFTKPTTSFKITHYLHTAGSRQNVAWKETRVDYETGFALTFDSKGGTSVAKQVYPEVTTDVTFAPTAPTRPSEGSTKYTFAGWYTDTDCTDGNEFTFGQTLAADTTVYAKWTTKTVSGYTVTFDSNGGSAIASQVVEPNGTCTVPPTDPTKATDTKYSYTFSHWCSDSALTTEYDFTTPVTDDMTLYAKYTTAIAPVADGALTYDLGAHAYAEDPAQDPYYWDNSAYSDKSNYFEIDVNSHDSFNKEKSLPNVNLTVEKLHYAGGINFLSTTYRNNPVIRMAKMTITSLEEGKRIVYARALCDSYGSHADTMHMYANGSDVACDTEEGPYNGGYSSRILQGEFSYADNVTSVSFAVGETSATYCQVKIRYVYIIYENSPELDAAISYATDFNNANVCGTTDDAGLDSAKWNQQAQAFAALDPTVQAVFNNYSGSDAEIVECLERYDRVVYLHGEDYDFMNRIDSDNIPVLAATSLFNIVDNTNVAIIVTIIAVISASSIAVALVLKRKRHE